MHCLKFLQVMADRNTELVNDFIMMVPVYPVAVGKQITDNTSQGASGPEQLRGGVCAFRSVGLGIGDDGVVGLGHGVDPLDQGEHAFTGSRRCAGCTVVL